jgi:hypothetical protein
MAVDNGGLPFTVPIWGKHLLDNKSAGVVHHKRICAGHLSKLQNQQVITDQITLSRLHGAKTVRILEALASGEDNRAVQYLQ